MAYNPLQSLAATTFSQAKLPNVVRDSVYPRYYDVYSRYGVTDPTSYQRLGAAIPRPEGQKGPHDSRSPEWQAMQAELAAINSQANQEVEPWRAQQSLAQKQLMQRFAQEDSGGGFFGSSIGRILGAVAPIALSFLAPGIGTALGSALGAGSAWAPTVGGALLGAGTGALTGGGVKGALLGAATGGAGGYFSGAGGSLSGAANTLGSVGKIIGAVNNVAGLFNQPQAQKPQTQMLKQQAIAGPAQAPEWSPSRPQAMGRPNTLNELAGFSQDQERSALATKGVNSGLGGVENSYYKNLLQRSLIGEGNQVNNNNPNFLMPIESSYFSNQGLNTSNLMEFLKGISA